MTLFLLWTLVGTAVILPECISLKWVPQLGTAEFPKHPDLSSQINKGDIFKFGDSSYFKALHDGKLSEEQTPDNNPNMWRKMTRGSFSLPKSRHNDYIASVGEIFKDFDSEKYYKSVCIPGDKFSQVKGDCLVQFNYRGDWMSLMKEEISDTRLGDLAIPGSHDTETSGLNEDSFLVDKNFLFTLGDLVVPEVLVNWSLCQDTKVMDQLNLGFRQLDLRIADCESLNDTFRWWHGLSGDTIEEGLQSIAEFSLLHPDEIIIIYFQNFVRPGITGVSGTLEITRSRKIELNELILDYLSDYLVPYVDISDNPTVNEVLSTGKNIIAMMQDSDIRDMSELYWSKSVVQPGYAAVANPEDLFNDRSARLKDYLLNYNDTMTDISGAFTPDEKTVTSAVLRVYGNLSIVDEILDRIAPGLTDFDPDMMSFEGVFIDLLNTARFGVNTNGMYIRPEDLYSNGISVHYQGMKDMYRHWLARPGVYKPNIVYVDDTPSSDIVNTAILANLDEIPKEASVSFQGNTRNGFYYWANFTALGGEEGLSCNNVDVRMTITSEIHELFEIMSNPSEVTLQEGQYPEDAWVVIEVTSPGYNVWYELERFHIGTLIEDHMDLYVRGDNQGDESGFAYVSTSYNLFGPQCGVPPSDGYIRIVSW